MTLPLNTEYVTHAFASGKVTTPQGPVECFVRQAGDLVLPTGRIVACDPLVFDEAEPFTVAVRAGSYPVSLAVAKVSENDQRVAFAKVTFAFADPVAWKMAAVAGQDPTTLHANHIFGYPVDSGTASFIDAEAAALLLQRLQAEDEYDQTIIEGMEKTYVHTWSYATVRPSARYEGNCVAFSSGWGDGLYASYFGYSAADDVVCLVTDFDVLWREDSPDEEADRPLRKPWWKFW